MSNEEIEELKVENTLLKRELSKLKNRLEKMQNTFAKQHEEIRKLRLEAGAKRVGPYKLKPTLEVNKVDKSNNI